ncbi:NPCBM/NEW2 domain-containing protein [Nonomuraea typhae]|uniref:NPCBM/NEW2 domain-containing protein n=1 Tax=Nonomuraea typhae TaxID=2603600 RepID=UPI0012F83E8B|nr:NPCBM/NEW2 domain-containing protein [Nonomuraea typhae]
MQRLTRLSLAAAAAATALAAFAAPASADEVPEGALLGADSRIVRAEDGRWVVVKPLPNGDLAVALYNESGYPQRIATTAAEVGLPPAAPAYRVRNLATGADHHTAGALAASVPPRQAVLYQVSRDANWAAYPPLIELDLRLPTPYPGAAALVEGEATTQVSTVVTNLGLTGAADITATLSLPYQWKGAPTGPATVKTLAPGQQLITTWNVSTPAGLPRNAYWLEAAAATTKSSSIFVVPPPAPSGRTYVSDLPWLSMANGQGAVERRKVTVNRTSYAKGLAARAPGALEYYLGGRCTKLSASVGVDDSAGQRGRVTFEIWADGRKAAETGPLTGAMPAVPLTADVTGARLVRLVVTDGGDGGDGDEAAWGDPVIACSG